MISSIGVLEFTSIAMGYEAQDAMLKAGAVDLVLARTICSGKYIVIVSGDVDAVHAAVDAGKETAAGVVIDELVIPYVDPAVFPALGGAVDLAPEDRDALGIVEAFSAISAIRGADIAAKTGDVTLFQIHLAMAVGGKGFFCITGDVSSVRAAVDAAVDLIGETGLLVGRTIIPRPRPELFQNTI